MAADRSILRRELALHLGAPSVFVAFGWLSTGGEDASLPWVVAIWIGMVLASGSLGALPFWIRFHRINLEATTDRLVARSGKQVILDLRRDEIVQIRVYGRADWSSLLWPHNHHPGPFPVLTVWSSNRWESPIMIWGKAAIELERKLNLVLQLPRYHG